MSADVSAILGDLRQGKHDAATRLVAVVYPELHRIADHYLRLERPQHTLQATALVHETWARMFGSGRTDWRNRAHFFAAIATEMRRILVDYARARNAQKGPGKRAVISLADTEHLGVAPDHDLLALDEALRTLAQHDARAARVVELKFFTGLNERDVAEVLQISPSTVRRDWEYARAWLFSALS